MNLVKVVIIAGLGLFLRGIGATDWIASCEDLARHGSRCRSEACYVTKRQECINAHKKCLPSLLTAGTKLEDIFADLGYSDCSGCYKEESQVCCMCK